MNVPASLLTILFVSLGPNLFGQSENSPIQYYEVIDGDSIKLFFSRSYNLTDKSCYSMVRLTRVNEQGATTGVFQDYTKDGILMGTGEYKNGKKSGLFETYYSDRSIKSTGFFSEDAPYGDWYFFYENGSLDRHLRVLKDTLLITALSVSGDTLVKLGKGAFKGKVEILRSGSSGVAEGSIQNSKREGKWNTYFLSLRENNKGMLFTNEIFDQGSLVKGIYPKAISDKKYCCNSTFSLFLEDYYLRLEKASARIAKCKDDIEISAVAKIKSGLERFKRQLEEFIKETSFQGPRRSGMISLKFTITPEGRLINFNNVSAIEPIYANKLAELIKRNVLWEPAFQKGKQVESSMYFDLYYQFSDHTYKYQFEFSPYDRIDLIH